MSIHIVCLNARLSGGQLASPSQRTAPGAMPEVPTKSFFFFFSKSFSHSGQLSPPWASKGASRMGWGLAGRGGGRERDLAAFVRPGRG